MRRRDFHNFSDVFCWVRDHCDWPPAMKYCYLLLYSLRDGNECERSLKSLEADLGVHRGTVIAWMRELEAVGVIEPVRRTDWNKATLTNIYRLHAPWEPALAAKMTGGGTS